MNRPLYFQHDGHSRTIVGIQTKFQRNGTQQYNLLILDPGHVSFILPFPSRAIISYRLSIRCRLCDSFCTLKATFRFGW